ncbi:hypothetical protein C8Q80DRAFT_908020 [Daedaleopsis nitida]|nr:hypothetical protein C8Q80DRAFT_908020 [Daedaleopsis nitida]
MTTKGSEDQRPAQGRSELHIGALTAYSLLAMQTAYKRAALVALRPHRTPTVAHTHLQKLSSPPLRLAPRTPNTRIRTMSSNIVLPDLPTWVQQRITALYSAKTAEDFSAAFDAFVAQHATIKVNGKSLSRDEYKKMVQGEITGDVGAEVTFNGVVSVPSESKDLSAIGTGTVGVFFKAVVFGRLFVLAQRQSSTVNSSMNVVYAISCSCDD